MRRVAATAVLGMAMGLVSVPAAEAAVACTWRQAAWELPSGTDVATIDGYDGSRYAVGVTGTKSPWGGTADQRGTVWDNGRVVLRIAGGTPHLRDVNSAGLVVGDDVIDDKFTAVTVALGGKATPLPRSPKWEDYSASLVNNAGDVVGSATVGSRNVVVVWPAKAPGTYRELPTPNVDYLRLTDVDEQGRIIAQTDSASGGGFVWDTDGNWRVLAARGAGGYGSPFAIRNGRVVGSADDDTSYAAAEWDARGRLVRTIRGGAVEAVAIGGKGTVGGYAFVGSLQRPALWHDGAVVDPLSAVDAGFQLAGISDDERSLVGIEYRRPVQYRCS